MANDGETALDIASDWAPDLMITDLSMPNMDGLELCRRFRIKSQAPIIVLSVKGEERTKVQALDAGADDYVTKPFGISELLARVRANLRRSPREEETGGAIEEGDFRIDLDAHVVQVRGREVKLTPKEFDLLVYLARHPRKVVTHRNLLAAVWGANSTEQPEYLRVFIGQLRKKIEADASARLHPDRTLGGISLPALRAAKRRVGTKVRDFPFCGLLPYEFFTNSLNNPYAPPDRMS